MNRYDDMLIALAEASVVPEDIWGNDDLVAHGRYIEKALRERGYTIVPLVADRCTPDGQYHSTPHKGCVMR